MSEISFGGLATGLPTEDIISSLMEAEKIPRNRLEEKKQEEADRLEAFKEFDDLLDDLRSSINNMHLISGARSTTANVSGGDDAISATSTSASPGSYNISVQQLAQVQKNVSDGVSSKTDSIFGEGTLILGDMGIVINEDNNSLSGIMNAVNSISDETGIKASIINNGGSSDNYHLIFTGKDASTNFDVTFDLKDSNGEAIEFNAAKTISAQQAKAQVDGIDIVSDSNTLKDVIPGVSVNLNSVSEVLVEGDPPTYETSTLTIEPDTDTVKENITEFVNTYNEIMEWIVAGYEYDSEDTPVDSDDDDDDSNSERSAYLSSILRGDSTINDIKRSLQTTLSGGVNNSSSYQIMSELGIKTQQDGTLTINNTQLEKSLEENYEDVVTLLAGDETNDGVMDTFNSYLLDKTSFTQGMFKEKTDVYNSKVKVLDQQIDMQDLRLESIELRYRAQFNAMELIVSELNNQSAFIQQYIEVNKSDN